VAAGWREKVNRTMSILQEEEKLLEIVQLVGSDALPEREQITLAIARIIRECLLQQNAYHDVDTYCDLKKTYAIMSIILSYGDRAYSALAAGKRAPHILAIKAKERIPDLKFEKSYEKLLSSIENDMKKEFEAL
jgi:V/A-type H+-transporting ATPase subunit A